MSHAPPSYNLAVVRELLIHAFEAGDLFNLFVYTLNPELQPVQYALRRSSALDEMADETIEYCRQRRLLPDLLAEVKVARPRTYAYYEPYLLLSGDDQPPPPPPLPPPPPPPPRPWAWVLAVLLCLDVGLAFLWVRCLFGGQWDAMAYLLAAVAAATAFFVIWYSAFQGSEADAVQGMLRRLGTQRIWTLVILGLTILSVALTYWLFPCRPTAYMELILDNGPAPVGHHLDELRTVLQKELSRTLPNSALALRVFGVRCGETERVVNFRSGNAGEVAEEVGKAQPRAYADLTEAIRWAIDDLLAQRGEQPRVIVAVTWGKEGCGGDLAEILDRYGDWLGTSVRIGVITVGDEPLVISQPGFYIQQFTRVEDVGPAMARLSNALEMGMWPPVPSPPPPTPTPTPTATTTTTPTPTPTSSPTGTPISLATTQTTTVAGTTVPTRDIPTTSVPSLTPASSEPTLKPTVAGSVQPVTSSKPGSAPAAAPTLMPVPLDEESEFSTIQITTGLKVKVLINYDELTTENDVLDHLLSPQTTPGSSRFCIEIADGAYIILPLRLFLSASRHTDKKQAISLATGETITGHLLGTLSAEDGKEYDLRTAHEVAMISLSEKDFYIEEAGTEQEGVWRLDVSEPISESYRVTNPAFAYQYTSLSSLGSVYYHQATTQEFELQVDDEYHLANLLDFHELTIGKELSTVRVAEEETDGRICIKARTGGVFGQDHQCYWYLVAHVIDEYKTVVIWNGNKPVMKLRRESD